MRGVEAEMMRLLYQLEESLSEVTPLRGVEDFGVWGEGKWDYVSVRPRL